MHACIYLYYPSGGAWTMQNGVMTSIVFSTLPFFSQKKSGASVAVGQLLHANGARHSAPRWKCAETFLSIAQQEASQNFHWRACGSEFLHAPNSDPTCLFLESNEMLMLLDERVASWQHHAEAEHHWGHFQFNPVAACRLSVQTGTVSVWQDMSFVDRN